MQPQRDPEEAVRFEFDTFAARGTVEAYELFIARHPDHPLAREAKRRIEALHGGDRRTAMAPYLGDDSAGDRKTGRPGTGGVMLPPPGNEVPTQPRTGRPGTGGVMLPPAGKEMPVQPRSARPGTGGIMPPPPDYEKAIRTEFDTFSARGTVEAYELFIARHPDHPLAREARRRIEAIRKSGRRGG